MSQASSLKIWVRLSLAVALLVLAAPAAALAHGGGTPQLVDAPAGAYHVYAWTSPNPVRVGTLHVTVALVDPADNQPVLGADVQVQLTPPAGAATLPVTAQATHDEATIKTYYETDLEVATAGPWQVAIAYQTPQAAGSAGFDLEVKPKSFTNWFMLGGAALVVIVVGWFVWPKRRPVADSGERMADGG